MSKFAKITLLSLVAFLVLGFSITVNAAKPTQVEVVNTPDVNVANTPETPVLVRNVDSTAQPIKHNFESFIDGGNCSVEASSDAYFVPEGKRLTIEYVSLIGHLPAGQEMRFGFSVHVNHQGTGHPIVIHKTGTFSYGAATNQYYAASQPVKIYVDAGFEINPWIHRDNCPGTAHYEGHFEGTFFGVLEDVEQ